MSIADLATPQPDWMRNAGCLDVPDPDIFFPRFEADSVEPKLVCRDCPVINACAAHALAVNEPYGVWGGLTEDERRSVRRRPERLASLHQRLTELDPGKPRKRHTTRQAAHHAAYREKVADLGVSAAEIRAWATLNNIKVASGGILPFEILLKYETATTATAA